MRLAVAAIVVFASVLSAPAQAQRRMETETGSNIAKPRAARPGEASARDAEGRGRQVMAAFARCSLDRRPRQVAQTLAMPLDANYRAALTRLASPDCLDSGELRFQPIHLRGGLFAEMLRRRRAAEAEQRLWGPVIPPFDPTAQPAPISEAINHHMLVDFATCVAQRDPGSASDFALAPEASLAEGAALSKLRPQLGPCWPAGRSLTLNRSTLKGPMAEALYRLPAGGLASTSVATPSEAKN